MKVDQFLNKIRRLGVNRLIASQAVGKDAAEQLEMLVTKSGRFYAVHVIHNETEPYFVQIVPLTQKGARSFWKRRTAMKDELAKPYLFHADKPYAQLSQDKLALIRQDQMATEPERKAEVLQAMKDPEYLELTKSFKYKQAGRSS